MQSILRRTAIFLLLNASSFGTTKNNALAFQAINVHTTSTSTTTSPSTSLGVAATTPPLNEHHHDDDTKEDPFHFHELVNESVRRTNRQTTIPMVSYLAKPNAVPASIVDIFTKAFAGSPTSPSEPVLTWGLHPFLPQEDKFSSDEWTKTFRFVLEAFIGDEGGTFLGVPTSQDNDNDSGDASSPDSYQAGVMIREFDPAVEFGKTSVLKEAKDGMKVFAGMVKSAVTGTMPSGLRSLHKATAFMTLFSRLTQESKELHRRYGPEGKHIYVAAVGVDPSRQGQGLGKRILRQVSDLSDATGLPAYLECSGDKNRAVYERSGYQVVGEELFSVQEYGGGRPYDMKLFFMTREPKQSL